MNVEAQERVKQHMLYVHTSLVVAVLTDLYCRVFKTEQELLHVVLISLMCGEMVAMVVHGWALQCISVTLAYR